MDRGPGLLLTAWNILLIKRGFTMMTDRGPGLMLTTWNILLIKLGFTPVPCLRSVLVHTSFFLVHVSSIILPRPQIGAAGKEMTLLVLRTSKA